MKIDLNDPQLTAYALGELHGQEAEEMKNRIAKDPEARKYVEDIQETAKFLSEELSQEPTEGLSPESRAKILRAEPKNWFRKSKWIAGLSVLATACIAVIVGTKTFDDSVVPARPQFQTELATPQTVQEKESEQIEDAYVFEEEKETPAEGAAFQKGAPEKAEKSVETKPVNRGKKFPSVKQNEMPVGSLPLAPSELPRVDKVGLLSAFGRGSTQKQLVEGYSGSAELVAEGRTKGHAGIGTKKRIGSPVWSSEDYNQFEENSILKVKDSPLSTFSIDVDTASYANVRRMLIQSQWPPKDAIRLEEMVNYFSYDYLPPTDDKPFSTHIEVAQTPWNQKSKLVRIALKGKEVPVANRPASNLVFLIDVSGSMSDFNKLPLVKKALGLLVDKIESKDKVAIVVYAGSSGLVLDSTKGDQKKKIREAIDGMSTGGSTNGGAGIELAYSVAQKNFVKGGINRVILATDGDFNVGTTTSTELTELIEEKAKSGVFLSVLGFGMGNLKDSRMQELSNKGNGNYAYVDSLREARKVLVEQAGGTLMTIAEDVKIQVEFNPKFVSEYRLIGYEKRKLNAEDFNDDTKDAGEIGAGHTVTAFYEVFPTGAASRVDALKYQEQPEVKATNSIELLTVKLRYKKPDGDSSEFIEVPVPNADKSFENASSDFKFAAAVAEFAQVLKESKYKGTGNLDHVLEVAAATQNLKDKEDPYRKEFVELVKKARSMKKKAE